MLEILFPPYQVRLFEHYCLPFNCTAIHNDTVYHYYCWLPDLVSPVVVPSSVVAVPSVSVAAPVAGLLGGDNMASQQTTAVGGVGSTVVANGAAHAGETFGRGKTVQLLENLGSRANNERWEFVHRKEIHIPYE